MKSAAVILGLLFTASARGQDFALVRSQIKTGGGSSASGTIAISGNLSMAESNQPMTGGQFAAQGSFTPLTFIAPAPVITSIAFAKSGTNIQLAWPTSATGYFLESTSSLKPTPIWMIETFPRTTAGSMSLVTIPMTSPPQIFRLRHASTLP